MLNASGFKQITFNLGIWLIVMGMCLTAWQFYQFFQFNAWSFISVAQALEWLKVPLDTLLANAHEAYTAARKTPLALALMGLGAVLVWQGT